MTTTLHGKEHKKLSLFMTHVDIQDDGCWIWTAAKNNIGYGMFRYDGKMRTAHRCMMHMEGHDIEGKTVYHTCNHYDCVNPQHLRVGSLEDKVQQMRDNGKTGLVWKDPKYHKTCPHCGYHGSPAVLGSKHYDKCKNKP